MFGYSEVWFLSPRSLCSEAIKIKLVNMGLVACTDIITHLCVFNKVRRRNFRIFWIFLKSWKKIVFLRVVIKKKFQSSMMEKKMLFYVFRNVQIFPIFENKTNVKMSFRLLYDCLSRNYNSLNRRQFFIVMCSLFVCSLL